MKIRKLSVVKKILMEFTRDSLSKEFDKDMELLNGIMDKFLKDNGEMELKMDLEFGDPQKEIFMREIGCWIDKMEKELFSIDSALLEGILLTF